MFTVDLNKKKADCSQNTLNKDEKFIQSHTMQNLTYLYPYGHRMTHQMRWFKFNRDRYRDLKKDIAA